jgi:hypothetical protein
MYNIIARHLDDLAEARLRVVIDRVFPLSQAAEARLHREPRGVRARAAQAMNAEGRQGRPATVPGGPDAPGRRP